MDMRLHRHRSHNINREQSIIFEFQLRKKNYLIKSRYIQLPNTLSTHIEKLLNLICQKKEAAIQ